MIYTNGGFLLTWYAPTNDIFQVQFTATWRRQTGRRFSNIITYTGPLTPTNGLFTSLMTGRKYPFGRAAVLSVAFYRC